MDPLIVVAFCPFYIFISMNVPLDAQHVYHPHNTNSQNICIYGRPKSTFFIRFEFKEIADDFMHNNGLGMHPREKGPVSIRNLCEEIVDWEKGQAPSFDPYRNKVERDYVMRADSICFYSQQECRQNLFPRFTWPTRIEPLPCICSANKRLNKYIQ